MFKQIEDNVKNAINTLKQGNYIIIVDDYDVESHGSLIIPSQKITFDNFAFMLEHTNGAIYLAIDRKKAQQLDLCSLTSVNKNNLRLTDDAFSIYREANVNIETYIQDIVYAIQRFSQDNAKAENLAIPYNLCPLISDDKGVLGIKGYTEATVDLMKLSGFNSAGALCKLVNKDSTMMKLDDIEKFAKKYDIPVLTIPNLYKYRLATEIFITKVVNTTIPFKKVGNLEMSVYKDNCNNEEVVVLFKPYSGNNPLVRIHSSCITGDIFGSLRCDCQDQLHKAIEMISKEGGFFIYLNQEGRGIGLVNKLKAYNLQMHENMDTLEANLALGLPADAREYDLAVQVLKYNNVTKCRLISNNPDKLKSLVDTGIQADPVYCEAFVSSHNRDYLMTKKNKANHKIKGI